MVNLDKHNLKINMRQQYTNPCHLFIYDCYIDYKLHLHFRTYITV